VRSGHPWLFADSIHELNRTGQPGELAVIYDRKDKFLAVGLFDPDSPSASGFCTQASRLRLMRRGGRQGWNRRSPGDANYSMRIPPVTASSTVKAMAGPAWCWIATARRSC